MASELELKWLYKHKTNKQKTKQTKWCRPVYHACKNSVGWFLVPHIGLGTQAGLGTQVKTS